MLFSPNKASDNALGIASVIDDPTVIPHDPGVEIHQHSG